MANPDRLQQLTIPIVNVYLAIEDQIMINAAKKLKKHHSLLTEDNIHSWQLHHLNELESLKQENIIAIAKHAHMSINEVTKMLKQAGYESVQEHEGTLQEAVQQGKLIKPSNAVTDSVALHSILSSYQAQAKQMFNLVNTTLLDQAQQKYLNIINDTVGKVLAGIQTPHQALRQAVSEWADKGVPALIDKAGRNWTPEAYVSMVTRTMNNKVANEMQFKRMQEYGADLIEVTSVGDARPHCYPWQGKIYSLNGTDKKYPAFSETSYGEPAGLFGINCKHVSYPFIAGISEKRYHQYPKAENDKTYQDSQKQRYLERRIRKAKREVKMMEEIGDHKGIEQAKQKVKNRQYDMRQFIDDTGRARQRNREQIYS